MAERVLHLVPKDGQAVCRRAISAARRRANQNELNAAYKAAARAAGIYDHSNAVAYYAAFAAGNVAAFAAGNGASEIYYVCYGAASAIAATTAHDAIAYDNERKNQCDIFRKYFTIEQVQKAFNKLVA
jgi:hypothetical protein